LEEAGIAFQPAFVGAKPSHMVTLSLAAPAEPKAPAIEELVHEQAVADLEPEIEPEPQPEPEPEPQPEPQVEEEPEVVAEEEEAESVEAAATPAQESRLQSLIDSQQQAWEQQR